jgi:hypothetical protein
MNSEPIKLLELHTSREKSTRLITINILRDIVVEGLGIKIALIDSGVDAWQRTIADNVKGGVSYYDKHPWYKADHPHGTQMASLMRRINPLVSLYIYGISRLRDDLNVEKAVLVG